MPEEFVCLECERTFETERGLAQHQRSSGHSNPPATESETPEVESNEIHEIPTPEEVTEGNEDRTYACPECGKTLEDLAQLNAHIKTHLPERTMTYADAVIKVLENEGKAISKDLCMDLAHKMNPSRSVKGAKSYSKHIKRLSDRKIVRVVMMVELTPNYRAILEVDTE